MQTLLGGETDPKPYQPEVTPRMYSGLLLFLDFWRNTSIPGIRRPYFGHLDGVATRSGHALNFTVRTFAIRICVQLPIKTSMPQRSRLWEGMSSNTQPQLTRATQSRPTAAPSITRIKSFRASDIHTAPTAGRR